MTLQWKLGPQQSEMGEKVHALVTSVLTDKDMAPPEVLVPALRLALGEAGLLCPDVPLTAGGAGRGLLEAMAAAEVVGSRLPRAVSAGLLEGAPIRLLGLHDPMGQVFKVCALGQATVGLLDASTWNVQLERRSGAGQRLTGEVPATPVPTDAHHLLFVFRHGSDGLALASVPMAHVSLRKTALPGLPLTLVQGLIDVEVPDAALVVNAPLEVRRALATEELVRSARSVGEVSAALERTLERIRLRAPSSVDGREVDGQVMALVADTATAVMVARTAVYAAAERLVDGGPDTLLGEEPRLGSMSAVLEARAVAHQALFEVAKAMDGCLQLGFHPTPSHDGVMHAAFMCSRLDLAALAPVDEAAGLWTRVGEFRLGALAALHSHAATHTTTHRGIAESRAPAPAEAVPTETAAPRPERKSAPPARAGTGRMTSLEAEWGPLPFVPEEASRFRLEMRKLVAEHLHSQTPTVEREGAVPAPLLELIKQRGCFGITLPQEHGGLGLGLACYLSAQEELGRAHGAIGSLMGGNNTVASYFLQWGGSAEQRAAWLPTLASGQAVCMLANALAEPLGGQARGGLRVVRPHDEQGTYVLEGTLPDVVHADVAGAFVLVAPTETAVGTPAGTVCLWIGRDAPGLSVRAPGPTSGSAVIGEGTLVFDSCHLPVNAVLGDPNHAQALFHKVMEVARLDLAARALGMATHGLELWRAALSGRSQATMAAHGRALGRLWARLAHVRALMWATAMNVEHGESMPAQTAALKLLATELCTEVLDQAVASAGPESMATESRLHEHLRHARGLRIRGGTSEMQRAALASWLIGAGTGTH